jgi:hypothetical protein
MEYFILGQDKRITNAVKPIGVSELVAKTGFTTRNWGALDDLPTQVNIAQKDYQEYVDFIANPLPLISDKLKQLFQKFDPDIFFKPVLLADQKQIRQNLYWLMVPQNCDCLSSDSEFHKNLTIKRLIIDSKKASGKWIFKIAGIMEAYIFVNLGVAESMLRRDFKGIEFKNVETEG